MARYADFKAAEAVLKAAFAALEDRDAGDKDMMIAVEPISGLDIFYSDGYAQKFVGKITLRNVNDIIVRQYYFDASGPDYKFPPKYDALWRSWIASVSK